MLDRVKHQDKATYAMHKSFLPLGPFLHSGLWVTLQLAHLPTPLGGLPVPRPLA